MSLVPPQVTGDGGYGIRDVTGYNGATKTRDEFFIRDLFRREGVRTSGTDTRTQSSGHPDNQFGGNVPLFAVLLVGSGRERLKG